MTADTPKPALPEPVLRRWRWRTFEDAPWHYSAAPEWADERLEIQDLHPAEQCQAAIDAAVAEARAAPDAAQRVLAFADWLHTLPPEDGWEVGPVRVKFDAHGRVAEGPLWVTQADTRRWAEAFLAATPSPTMPAARRMAPEPKQCDAEACESGCACPGDCIAAAPPAPAVQEMRVMVCGVDCHPGDKHCNGYCAGRADSPPDATDEQRRAFRIEQQASGPYCDQCGKSKRDGWSLYCVECLKPAFAAAPAVQASIPLHHIMDMSDAYAQACNLAHWANAAGTMMERPQALYEAAAKLRDMLGRATHAAPAVQASEPEPLTFEQADALVGQCRQRGTTDDGAVIMSAEDLHALIRDTERAVAVQASEPPPERKPLSEGMTAQSVEEQR